MILYYDAKKIKEIRTQYDLTQSEFAKSVNISRSLVSHYEQGIKELDFDTMNRILNKYNLSHNYFISYKRLVIGSAILAVLILLMILFFPTKQSNKKIILKSYTDYGNKHYPSIKIIDDNCGRDYYKEYIYYEYNSKELTDFLNLNIIEQKKKTEFVSKYTVVFKYTSGEEYIITSNSISTNNECKYFTIYGFENAIDKMIKNKEYRVSYK